MLGVRIGGDQRERGEVVAGDPGGAVGVEHVGPVAQPQHEPVAVRARVPPAARCPRRDRRRRRSGRARSRTTVRSGPARAGDRRPGSPGATAAPTRPGGRPAAAPATSRVRSSAGRAAAGRPPRRRSRSTTSRSPDSAASTLACAASSTELSGTASSSASRRSAATRSSGIGASCSATPGTGSRVHRGIAVNPPATSTPRQNSRLASVTGLSSLRISLRTPSARRAAAASIRSNLPGRVAAPPCVRRDLLALHEEGVGGEHRAVAHRHAVVDERADRRACSRRRSRCGRT